MDVEHTVYVMRQYGVTAGMLQAIAVEFGISKDQFVFEVMQILECRTHLDVLSEMSKSPDVVNESTQTELRSYQVVEETAPEYPEFNQSFMKFDSAFCEDERKAGRIFYRDQCLTTSSFCGAGDRHREIHAKTPPKEAGHPGKSAEVSLPSSPVSRMIIDIDEHVGGGEDGNRIELLDMWTFSSLKSKERSSEPDDSRRDDNLGNLGAKAIKICSLNVNGLRRFIQPPFKDLKKFKDLINEHDISCFTETNTAEEDTNLDIPGYFYYVKHRKQVSTNRKKRSGGICIYIRERLKEYVQKIDCACEYILWIKLKNVFQTMTQPLILGAVYIPPDNSYFWKDDLLSDFENEVLSKCAACKDVILTGDFNSRTALLRDFIPYDVDNNYKLLKELSMPLKRSSADNIKVNTNGARLMETCQNNNLLMLNGRFSHDKDIGKCTFFKEIIKDGKPKLLQSLIDYTFATVDSFKLLKSFDVVNHKLSDHHSLVLELKDKTL